MFDHQRGVMEGWSCEKRVSVGMLKEQRKNIIELFIMIFICRVNSHDNISQIRFLSPKKKKNGKYAALLTSGLIKNR